MDKFCRICLRADDFRKFDISTISQISGIRIEDMLIYCTQLVVTSKDGLPQQICAECLAALSACFVFKKQCFRTETNIREMLKNQTPEMHPEPSLEYELSLLDADFRDGPCPEAFIEPVSIHSAVADPELTEPTTVECVPSNVVQCQTSQPKQRRKTGAGKLRKVRADKLTKLYLCNVCHFRTIYRTIFDAHRADTKHNDMGTIDVKLQKTLVCNGCGYKSTGRQNFHRHQRIKKHSGFKVVSDDGSRIMFATLYKCNECDFRTFIRADYEAHQTGTKHQDVTVTEVDVDTVIKLKTCGYCGQNFKSIKSHRVRCRAQAQQLTETAQAGGVIDDAMSDGSITLEDSEASQHFGDGLTCHEELETKMDVKYEADKMYEEVLP